MTEKLTPAKKAVINTMVEYTRRTRDTAEGVTGWGGVREGSGRPATGRKRRQYYLDNDEDAKVRQFIQELRNRD